MLASSVRTRRIKFWWNLASAYLSRYKLRALTLLTLLIAGGFLIYKLTPVIFRSNVVSVGYVGAYSIENIPSAILTLVTQPLASIDEQGRPQPSLASHWTVADDGKTYVVFLKDNIYWHDATLVDAQTISIAISNVQITAINNKTIEFKLPNPIASFPQALNKPIFKTNSFYGTGNFRIVKIDQVDGVVRKIILHPKDTKLPRVEIKFYPTQEQLTYALKIGEVKTAQTLDAKNFESYKNLDIEKKVDPTQTVTIFFKNNDPVTGSKELRQALYYAIERENFDGQVANGPISPSSWAYNNSIKRYDYNTGKAKELLSKVGNQKLKITLSTTPGLDTVAQKIAKDWQAIGVDVEIKEEETLPKDFQALLAINQLPQDPDQYSLWHSSQKETNITSYQNVKIDKLLEDARATTDEAKRKELYLDFQKFLTEDAPAIFLYHPYRYKITYKNARNQIAKLPNF